MIKIILEKFVAANPFKIYIFTHDKSFHNLCKQRITQTGNPTSWLFYEMYTDMDKDPRRPYIDTHTDAFEKAEKHLKAFQYAASANALRQGLENFIFPFLPENERYKEDKGKIIPKTLGELLGALQAFHLSYGKGVALINDLFVYKDFLLNPLSHDNINTPVFRNELDAIFNLLPALRVLQTTLLKEVKAPPNNTIRLIDTDANGDQVTYEIELYEHLRSFILLDGTFHLSKSKCKVVTRIDNLGLETIFNNHYETMTKACNRLVTGKLAIGFYGKAAKYIDDQDILNHLQL